MESKFGFAVFTSVVSLLMGSFIGYYLLPKVTNPAMPFPEHQAQSAVMLGEAKHLILDALQAQADVRATDAKYDSAQQETIRLLIPAKLAELRDNPISEGDLLMLDSIYKLIEQPNGLRASRENSGVPPVAAN